MPERTFTIQEHEAVLADAVQREVAATTASWETEKAALANQVDVLAAEKAAAEKARDDAVAALEEANQKAQRDAEIAARKDGRVEEIKALGDFKDDYFTETRITRWAEMADADFESLLDDLADATVTSIGVDAETATRLAALSGADRRAEIAKVVAARRPASTGGQPTPAASQPRVTAAFRGGQEPTVQPQGGQSALGQLLGAVAGQTR